MLGEIQVNVPKSSLHLFTYSFIVPGNEAAVSSPADIGNKKNVQVIMWQNK